MIRANALSVENQKKGQTTLGRTVTTNAAISMEHFMVMQENGLINEIILVINPQFFVAVDRSSKQAADETEIVALAAQIANHIQGNTAIEEPTTTPNSPEEDIIRAFFTAIGEHHPSEAVALMSLTDESTKQVWAVQFNAFQSVKILSITHTIDHTYKIQLEVQMKSEAASAPIPNYGYENGVNTRWVSVEKVGGGWKIAEIATGP